MNIDDNLNTIFDLEPTEYKEIVPKKTDIIISDDVEVIVKNDFDNVRDNLYSLLDVGKEALDEALEVAKQSESPRSYEVVSTLLKQLADTNLYLMDIHEKKQKLNVTTNKNPQTQVTNNAIFVGSTTELAKMISDMNK